MQNIFDTHDYDEHFLDQFISQTIPIYDMWSVRPMQNEQKVLASGTPNDIELFSEFMNEHSVKDYPHPIVIVVGNTEKHNPSKLLASTMKYFKLKFDKFKGNDIVTPLMLDGFSKQTDNNAMPYQMMGNGQRPGTNPNGGISYNEIQGIIDRNVSDATRSIRSEYEEVNAKREVDAIKRIAELEAKMEMYKLEMRESEIDKKERKLQEEKEAFDNEKANGMGTLKDYTKTIAGGLIELGKSAFGLDDKSSVKKEDKTTAKEENDLKGTEEKSTKIDDDGFSETEPEDDNPFQDLIHVIENLSDDQKYALLDVLVPGEKTEEIIQQPESTEEVDSSSNEDENDSNIETS